MEKIKSLLEGLINNLELLSSRVEEIIGKDDSPPTIQLTKFCALNEIVVEKLKSLALLFQCYIIACERMGVGTILILIFTTNRLNISMKYYLALVSRVTPRKNFSVSTQFILP